MAYDSAGCTLHVDPSKFDKPGLTELTWKSDIFESSYVPAGSNPFKLRLDSMFVGFMGRGFGPDDSHPSMTIATAVQNVGHSFSSDAVGKTMPFPALGI